MTPHNKSNSDEKVPVELLSQQVQQPNERPRSSSLGNRDDAPNTHSSKVAVATTSYNLVRCKSDTTSSKSSQNHSVQQLQTITSGIALDEMKSPEQYLPPLSPFKGNHSPHCMYYNSPLIRRKSLPNDSNVTASPQQQQSKGSPQLSQHYQLPMKQQLPPSISNIHSYEQDQPNTAATHRSQNSYSSIDTSLKKATFIQQLRANSHRDNDSDSIGDSLVDSIVFHYTPGEEVPPSEYALSASSLKVSGMDCECFNDAAAQNYLSETNNLGSLENENYQIDTIQTIESSIQPINRYELIPPQSQDQQPSETEQQRILPYNERKRLTEIREKKEKKNARKEPKLIATKTRETNEKSTLINKEAPIKDEYGQNQPHGFRLVDHLTALIMGKQTDSNMQRKQYGSVEYASKQYRDRGEAFLLKTQKQRSKNREQSQSDELHNVTVPVSTLHAGHSRSKMSSLSNALDSIADCSDDEDSSSYSDEETGSSYYDSETSRSNTTESSKKVWKHGDPSITSKRAKREKIMERERLLQEEYEYRLRRLTKENTILARKFRLVVLVTVAFILVAALSFALLLCVKILLLGS